MSKTIEQKAEEYIEPFRVSLLGCETDLMKDAYIAGAKEALAGQWIELTPNSSPPINQEVLCLGDTGDVAVLQMVYTNLKPMGRQLAWLPAVKCKITHWMSIPEPPKTEEK